MTLSLSSGKSFFKAKIMDSPNGLKTNAFHGFVPRHLEIKDRPELNLFPLNLLFVGLQKNNEDDLIMGSSVYEPDLSTFRLDNDMFSLRYDNIYGDGWVVIEFNTSTRTYLGTKYINGVSVGSAIGMDWSMFFVHLTGIGLVNYERCKLEKVPSTGN
jgi:hypothetical protein